MALMKISSKNQNLSFALMKNPETQVTKRVPFKKSTATLQGQAWFPDPKNPTTFVLYGKKIVKKGSEDFEYLDFEGQSNPEFYLLLIQEFLRNAFKAQDTNYDTMPVTIEFNVAGKYNLNGIFGETKLLGNHKNSFSVIITADSLHKALNEAALYCYIQYAFSSDFYFVDDQYKKYLNLLVSYTENYTLINRFLSVINSQSKYEAFVKEVDHRLDYNFNFGNNGDQRSKAITEVVKQIPFVNELDLIDVGAGEGHYCKTLSGVFNNIIAYEVDPEVFVDLQWTITKKQLTNVTAVNVDALSLDPTFAFANEESVLLCTEVLEHIDYKDAVYLVKNFTKEAAIPHIILTVPNKEFNVHYGMADDEVRIPDHVWEPTRKVFELFLKESVNSAYEYEIFNIGNSVKDSNVSSTMLAYLKLKPSVSNEI